MRLSDGHHDHALWCGYQRQAHLARCAPRLLALERLQIPSSFGGDSDLLPSYLDCPYDTIISTMTLFTGSMSRIQFLESGKQTNVPPK
jgi:hypothetical protein